MIRSDISRNGGGVACYVRNYISFNVNEVLSDYIENINFDILLPKTKPILIGVIYRHQDKADFNDHFSDALDKINSINNREVYILGDFNIDDKSRLAKPYKEICSLHGLKQIIHSPTRITNTTSTILDHILTNSKDKLSQSGVIDIGISDHQMKFCTIKIMQQKFFKHKYIKIRSLKNYSKEILLEKLQEINFPNYINFDDINVAYTDFSNRLIAMIEKIAPLKQICIRNNSCEWVDQEIINGIRIRDKLIIHFRKTGLYSRNIN